MRSLALALPPALLFAFAAVAACSDGASAPGVEGSEAQAPSPEAGTPPPQPFERFCQGRGFDGPRTPVTLPALGGKAIGAIEGLQANTKWKAGGLEAIKVIPEHPFVARKIRVSFARGAGAAFIRLVQTFGRSYPGNFPSARPETLPDHIDPPDLVEPVYVEVAPGTAAPDQWMEFDIPEAYLLPTQHYMLVYEHVQAEPYLSLEDVPKGAVSASLAFQPPARDAYGIPGNFRIQVAGEYACARTEKDFLFAPFDTGALADAQSGWAGVADIDGDGHDDILVVDKGPKAWMGDGKGHFSPASQDPFPDARDANSLVFADLDNDGDLDAFANVYVQPDGDGDGYTVLAGDCDDTNPAVHRGAREVADNGLDDDCDGKADDGAGARDADGDGRTIAQGDCDDTRKDVYPGAPELLDGRDNDCNGKSDEIFVSKILQNDGKGRFSRVPNPDVEVLAPSTDVALGDGNGDGILDIYAGSWLVHYPDFAAVPSRYWEGRGANLFQDALVKAGLVVTPERPPYGVIWTDWNNDGLLDIYVSNYNLRDNILWKNLGGTFVDVAPQVGADHDSIPTTQRQYPGGHSFGSDTGDIDNDGDIDVFVPNISHPRTQPWADPSMLLVNQGAPKFDFKNERRERGIVYDEGDVNATFADFDNDMDLDLVVTPTYPGHYSRLYLNDGAGRFVDATYEARVARHQSQGAVWSDVDEDGDLDLILVATPPDRHITVFENRVGNRNHWVYFRLVGTRANKDAIGARVTIKAGGVTQVREVKAEARHQSTRWVHFGLGPNTAIESLTVRWGSGAPESIVGAGADGRFTVVEGSGKATR